MKADPSGEAECCIGNNDIHYVDICPAYYDLIYLNVQVMATDILTILKNIGYMEENYNKN